VRLARKYKRVPYAIYYNISSRVPTKEIIISNSIKAGIEHFGLEGAN